MELQDKIFIRDTRIDCEAPSTRYIHDSNCQLPGIVHLNSNQKWSNEQILQTILEILEEPKKVKILDGEVEKPLHITCFASILHRRSVWSGRAIKIEEESDTKTPVFRDIRRYYGQYCGICRSKKSLITSHVLYNHQEEMKEHKFDEEKRGPSLNVCEKCGAEFKKPAHLKQHMLIHSLERSFICPADDCGASYRRKDHLNRHLLQHKGMLFKCPIENCNKEFTIKGSMQRHLKVIHDEKHSSDEDKGAKKFVCSEFGCGKEFKYESKLRTHEESHIKLDSVEVFCAHPACMKPFTNRKCLDAHIHTCHHHVICDTCGTKQLQKNIKLHLRTHEGHPAEEIKCSFAGCKHAFTTKSNLQQHINAVHLELRPYLCTFPGCGKRFPFKHVRDNHEKSSCHKYVPGDLEQFDGQFRSRPRVGRKRSCPTINSLLRKRVAPPSHLDSPMNDSAHYLSWLLSGDE